MLSTIVGLYSANRDVCNLVLDICCQQLGDNILLTGIYVTVCDGTQNFKRYFFPIPNISDTDTGTFFGTKFFRYRFRYPLEIFWIPKCWQQKSAAEPNFSDTGSETCFRYQIFPIPVPRLFLVPNFSDTDTDTFSNLTHLFCLKYLQLLHKNGCNDTFSGTKFFQYRFPDFHLHISTFPIPVSLSLGKQVVEKRHKRKLICYLGRAAPTAISSWPWQAPIHKYCHMVSSGLAGGGYDVLHHWCSEYMTL